MFRLSTRPRSAGTSKASRPLSMFPFKIRALLVLLNIASDSSFNSWKCGYVNSGCRSCSSLRAQDWLFYDVLGF